MAEALHLWQTERVDGLPGRRRCRRPDEESDTELCLRARQGDTDAFHAIFRRNAPAVRRFLAGALKDADKADEATQETFVRAHARLSALKDPRRLRLWLLGIARIVALDAHLFQRRDRERLEEQARATVVDLDPTPEARLLDAEAERVLAARNRDARPAAPRGAAAAGGPRPRLSRNRRYPGVAPAESAERDPSRAAADPRAGAALPAGAAMDTPGREALDACAAGELPEARAAAVESHAAGCPSCGQRLEWLRRENEAIREWAADSEGGDVDRLWGGVRARIERRPRRWRLPAAAATAVVIAAGVAAALHSRMDEVEQTPSAAAAMTDAEREYARAIDHLEKQVAARQGNSGRHEPALRHARSGLARARASAGDDAASRVRVLEGYAAYLKSLRRALREEQP